VRAGRQIRAAKIGRDRQARLLQWVILGENGCLRLLTAKVPKLLLLPFSTGRGALHLINYKLLGRT